MSSEESTFHDLIVIGAGFAGLAAARHAAQKGLRTAMLEQQMFGGLALNVNELDGAVGGSGADASSALMEEVDSLGVQNLSAVATQIAVDGDQVLVTSDSGEHRARAVILACGAQLRKLGVPGEEEFVGRGVSHCADCDGPMLEGEDAVVVGGGDSALQSALVLAKFCKTVHLVHRGDEFSAAQHFTEALARAANIVPHMHSVVDSVEGGDAVTGVQLRDVRDGGKQSLPCNGIFMFVGLKAAAEFLPGELKRDERGFLVTGADMQTSLPRVFAAGAVRSGNGGMIEHAMADGVAAANAAATLVRA